MKQDDDMDHAWVTEQLKSGVYYKDARDWFDLKYQALSTHKAYFLLITVIAGFTGCFTAFGFLGLLPIEQPVEMMRYSDDVYEEYARMLPLSERYANADQALIRYHVTDYVRSRERYVVRDLEEDVARIRALSSTEAYKIYRRWLHPSNDKGPIARFERRASRIVDVLRIRYLYDGVTQEQKEAGALPTGAAVEFTGFVVQKNSKKSEGNFVAKVAFDYVPVKVDQETEEVTQMQFTVTQYRVEKLSRSATQ